MGGMAELFAFVKVLEDNWHAVMRGVSIKYGSTTKTQQDISMSIGWQKPPKRNPALRNKKSINDGQAPDTTAALLPKNMGRRPKYSKNVDRSPFTTYVSYSELDDPSRRNRCWMSATLEMLFNIFNPLWMRGTAGIQTDIFTLLIQHFTSRNTWEISLKGHIKSTLSRGQSRLFDAAAKLHPGSFVPGAFASCDFFLKSF
jgi:hypothetical protein